MMIVSNVLYKRAPRTSERRTLPGLCTSSVRTLRTILCGLAGVGQRTAPLYDTTAGGWYTSQPPVAARDAKTHEIKTLLDSAK
jgi:hypothetical protein